MSNKYCNLDGAKLIKDDFNNINIGFDKVQTDIETTNKSIDDKISDIQDSIAIDNIIINNKIDQNKTDSDNKITQNKIDADTKISQQSTRSDVIQQQLDNMVSSGDSSPAIAQALAGTGFDTLREYRINNDELMDNKASYSDIETQTGTKLQFNNTEDSLVKVAKIQGATYQNVTTTGKNLVNVPSQNVNWGPVTDNLFYCKPNTTYTISAVKARIPGVEITNTYVNRGIIREYDGETLNSEASMNSPFVLPAGASANIAYTFTTKATTNKIIFDLGNNNGDQNVNTNVSNIQLELGSTATAYEPFIPNRPSPDYPSDIYNANYFKITAYGKNVLPFPYSLTNGSSNGVTYSINSNGSITLNGTATGVITLWIHPNNTLMLPAGTYTVSLLYGIPRVCYLVTGGLSSEAPEVNDNPRTFTLTKEGTIGYIALQITGGTYNNLTIYPQIERGTVATSYEPYKSNTINMDYKIADEDTIEVGADGKTRLIQRKKAVILNGSETGWLKYPVESSTEYTVFELPFDNAKVGYQTSICSHFSNINGIWDSIGNGYSDHPGSNNKYFEVKNTILGIISTDDSSTRVSKLKTWLVSNPVTILYELATPTETIIPDIYLTSYQGATHVSTNSYPQVTLTASAKSQLWNNSRKIDILMADGYRPNMLINGDFQIWQRGWSFNGVRGMVYTADRWRTYPAGGSTLDVNRTSDGNMSIKSSLANTDSNVHSFIDIPKSVKSGTMLTLSAKIDGVIRSIAGALNTTSLVNITGNVRIAALTNAQVLEVNISPIDTNEHIIEWVKLEMGDRVTPFISRSYAEELTLCQRYFRPIIMPQVESGLALRKVTANTATYPLKYPQMRVAPSLVISGTSPYYGRLLGMDSTGALKINTSADITSVNLYSSTQYESDFQVVVNFTFTDSSNGGLEFDTWSVDRSYWLDAEY